MDLRLILNNTLSVPIKNFQELNLDFSYNDFSPNVNILSEFMPEFYATADDVDAYNFINNWIIKFGVGQNIPAPVVDLDSGLIVQSSFLDLGADGNEFDQQVGRYKIDLGIENNSFLELAAGMPIRNFYEESDFVKTRYVRQKVPDYLGSAVMVLAIFVTVQQSIQVTKDALDKIRAAIPDSPTAINIGVIIKVGLIVSANLLYITLVLIALFNMLKSLSEAVFGKPKAYYAFDVIDLLNKGCEILNFKLSSTILDELSGLTIMAATTEEGVLRGKPKNNPLPNITLLEMFNRIGKLVNAKLKVGLDRIIQFEKKTTFETTPGNLVLQDIWLKGPFAFNTSELNQAIEIKFANAFTDANIKDNKFTVMFITDNMKANARQNVPVDIEDSFKELNISLEAKKIYSNIKTELKIDMSFARAERKIFQTILEKLFNSIFDILTGINKDAKLKVGERKNLMVLETDAVPVDLIYFRDDEKIDPKTSSYFLAKNIMSLHYQSETPFENQYIKHTNRGEEPLFNEDTVIQLINNNVARNEQGRLITVTKNTKNAQTDLHEFEYKLKLQKGDFGFIEEENFEVFVVEDSLPERKKFSWKEWFNFILT